MAAVLHDDAGPALPLGSRTERFDAGSDSSDSTGRGKATSERFAFDRVARVSAVGDNVAIATRRLEAGTKVAGGEGAYRISHTVPDTL